MPRITIKSLIEVDLGYCCEYLFFRLYRPSGTIAARLGVTTRAIRKKKESLRNGGLQCAGSPDCMKKCMRGLLSPGATSPATRPPSSS